MKPNYCSGGAIITGGRLSNFNNFSRSNSSRSLDSQISGIKNVNVQSGRNGVQRQQQQEQQSKDDLSATTMTARPSSPFIVYRSAKYVRPHARFFKTARGYAKYYILVPAVLLANRCKNIFYQLCGILLLLVSSPLWILLLSGIFIVRRLRLLLIKRFYPDLHPMEGDCNRYESFGSNESLGGDIVNSLVWTRGKLDVHTIRKRFKLLFAESPHLRHLLGLKLVSKFGVTLWESDDDNLSLEHHVVESPKKFHNCPIVDEPLKELYRTGANKSILQKYISYCVSVPLEGTAPPWKIHVVSYISREDGIKEKTCLVIRMHVALIKNHHVRNALRELFVDSAFTTPKGALVGKRDVPNSMPGVSEGIVNERRTGESMQTNVLNYLWNMGNVRQLCIGEKIKEICLTYQKNLGVWIDLRVKQLEFHSKSFVMSLILVDVRDAIKRCAASLEIVVCEFWTSVFCCIKYVVEILQALAAIPIIILGSLMKRAQYKKLGLQRNVIPAKRLISWSDLLHSDLIEEICKKTGTSSSGDVIMMACSNALMDYYQQNNIPDPDTVGFLVGNAMDITCSASLKAIRVPCNVLKFPLRASYELQKMEDGLATYPRWKMLGLWYTMKYSSYFMPTCLAQKVQRRIVSCYPFSFSHVNMNSVDSFLSCQEPIHQVYGEIVEEFSFWQLPPFSEFGVSITLVQYSGKTRIFVMSPFQSMDTVLTQRCNQYLIKIAEDVGVERSRIPYSRRSSPASTSCSTPQNPPYIFNNHSEKCGF